MTQTLAANKVTSNAVLAETFFCSIDGMNFEYIWEAYPEEAAFFDCARFLTASLLSSVPASLPRLRIVIDFLSLVRS